MMNRLTVLNFLIVILMAALLEGADPAGNSPVDGRGLSVYRIDPVVDGSVLGLASAGAVVPLFFESSLVHPHTLGDPRDINSIDRTVVGNHNPTVNILSDVTVALAIGVPVGLDLHTQGWNKELGEDFVVYAQVLAINSAVSNAARYSVQRPARPDVYRPGAKHK